MYFMEQVGPKITQRVQSFGEFWHPYQLSMVLRANLQIASVLTDNQQGAVENYIRELF